MAIGVQQDFRGATLAQYDEVIGKMGFRPGGPGCTWGSLSLGSENGGRYSRSGCVGKPGAV